MDCKLDLIDKNCCLTCLAGAGLPLDGCELIGGDLLEPRADRVLHQVGADGRVQDVQLRARLARRLKLLDDLAEKIIDIHILNIHFQYLVQSNFLSDVYKAIVQVAKVSTTYIKL